MSREVVFLEVTPGVNYPDTGGRQALKLHKFLQKVDQKLANKVARLKQQKKLPPLDAVVRSAGVKAGSIGQ
jgi:hypothetical protein